MYRLDTTLRRMEYLVFGSASKRLSSLLIALSDQFGQKADEGILIDVPLTHKDLGNLAGLSRETTSAIMSELKKKGFINDKKQGIVIRDLPQLTKASLIS